MRKTFTVRGQKFKIQFVANLGKLPCGNQKGGDCEPPKNGVRIIRVLKGLKGEALFEVILHELTHAAFWDLDESVVEEWAQDVTNIMFSGILGDSITIKNETA